MSSQTHILPILVFSFQLINTYYLLYKFFISDPKVTTVIYFTLSSNFQENEGVVRNCLEEFNEKCENPAHRFNLKQNLEVGANRLTCFKTFLANTKMMLTKFTPQI